MIFKDKIGISSKILDYLGQAGNKKNGTLGCRSHDFEQIYASIAIFSFFMAFFSSWRTRSAETPY